MVTIERVGLEQYAPGGNARVQMLLIGGPGAGKTRTASFWPKPIYADCERGMASVADRGVLRAEIKTSQDMLDLLAHLERECRKPRGERKVETLVVDTLDAYQRIVQDEWVRKERAQSFGGGEAWGYLDGKMQILMRRALNLDMNVVMLVHYEEKKAWGEDEVKTVLQMQGKIKDQVFNDFDLVGWIGTYWDTEDGERVKKRGITFESTPGKDFLKDRFHVMPDVIPVTFTEDDYNQLFAALLSKIDDLDDTEEVEKLEEYDPRLDVTSTKQGMPVPTPDDVSGPMPEGKVALPDLDDLTKAELQDVAGKKGISIEDDEGKKLLKADLKARIEKHLLAESQGDNEEQAVAPEDEEAATEGSDEAPAPQEATESDPEPADESDEQDDQTTEEEAEADQAEDESPDEDDAEEATSVDEAPQEEPGDAEQAESEESEEPKSESPSEGGEGKCEECSKSLEGENEAYVRLSKIKYRKTLCNQCFLERRREDG